MKCEMCGINYKYFIWSLGSDRCLCKTCVTKRPHAILDDDRLDFREARELDYIEENQRDGIEKPSAPKGRLMIKNKDYGRKYDLSEQHKQNIYIPRRI